MREAGEQPQKTEAQPFEKAAVGHTVVQLAVGKEDAAGGHAVQRVSHPLAGVALFQRIDNTPPLLEPGAGRQQPQPKQRQKGKIIAERQAGEQPVPLAEHAAEGTVHRPVGFIFPDAKLGDAGPDITKHKFTSFSCNLFYCNGSFAKMR